MNETNSPRHVFRGVGAVLAGLVAIFVLSIATDLGLERSGVYPPVGQRMADPLFVLALVYRTVYGVVGCFIAARLAPDRPMRHAMILGVVGVVFSTAGAIAMWKAGPPWYSLGAIAISLPCAWIGGKLGGAR